MKSDVIVLGIGNPLMSDEGIGGFLIKRFAEKQSSFPQIEFLDAGTGGMALLTIIEGRKKVVLIDCAYMNESPGTIKRFMPEDVESVKQLTHRSLHEADILKIIEIAKELGTCPEEIVFFGIEPEIVAQGEQLSDSLASKIDDYIAVISKELS